MLSSSHAHARASRLTPLFSLSLSLSPSKITLFGDGDAVAPSKETALALAADACAAGLPERLVDALPALEFEARKDAAQVRVKRRAQRTRWRGPRSPRPPFSHPKWPPKRLIFLSFSQPYQVVGAIFRLDASTDPAAPGSLYLASHPHLLSKLVSDYASPSIALNAGALLRDALRVPACAAAFLSDRALMARLLSSVEAPNFEVASDAFATLRDLLTRHKEMVAGVFLGARYDDFCRAFADLTASQNYVTRRQSVRLLGEVLLDRAYSGTLIRYVADPDHLKAAMVLLKDASPAIQFEAFHVFKAFVANPAKPPGVVEILAGNKNKLLKHLADFHVDKEDEQFREEKAVVVREISRLADPSGEGGEGGGSSV